MHEIVEHYGKVILALFAIAAILLLAGYVVFTITKKTKTSVDSIDYEDAKTKVSEAWGNNTNPTTPNGN